MEAKLYMYPLGTMYTSHMQTRLTFQTTNNSFHLENLCSMQFVLVHFIKLFTAFTSHFFQSQLVKVGIIAILEERTVGLQINLQIINEHLNEIRPGIPFLHVTLPFLILIQSQVTTLQTTHYLLQYISKKAHDR